MTWVRLEDSFFDHPKVVGLSDRAFRVFVNALCYANKHLTDGAVSASAQHYLRCTKPVATELVRAGLWEIHDLGAFRIHDYHAYQPSRAEVERLRADRAAAGRVGARVTNLKRWKSRQEGRQTVGKGVDN